MAGEKLNIISLYLFGSTTLKIDCGYSLELPQTSTIEIVDMNAAMCDSVYDVETNTASDSLF